MTTTMTLSAAVFDDMAAAATRAPSLHNSQPLRLRNRAGCFEILLDAARTPQVADPAGWGARLACGAAAFNARLALTVTGIASDIEICPDPNVGDLIARIRPIDIKPPSSEETLLHTSITRRFSNRLPFWPAAVGGDSRARLTAAAAAEGAWLELFSDTPSVYVLAELARAADSILTGDTAYRAEQNAWRRADDDYRDGVPPAAGGYRPRADDLLPARPFGGRSRPPQHDHEQPPLLAVLGSYTFSTADDVRAGMALQRVLLTADAAGLSTSLFSQIIEVPAAREHLRLALGRTDVPQMLLRVGYGRPGFPTARRDPSLITEQE
jgi:nitroreductase